MKSLTTISVQGNEQSVWEIYTDDTREQTFAFVFSEEDAGRVERLLLALKATQVVGENRLTDSDPMPFGKHKGIRMEDVPAKYLHWLWSKSDDPLKNQDKTSPVADYIKRNLELLKIEYEDGIW